VPGRGSPIEIWRLEHDGHEVITGYGPFAEVRDTDGRWRPVEWSLSRGVRDDPVHHDTLGPKGYVPEEFLDWRHVRTGERVAVRTHLTLPDRPVLHLAVGAGAPRRVMVDGRELPVHGQGYQSFSPLPHDRTVELEIEFIAEQNGPLRASFAVVTDPAAYRRPEWLTGKDLTHTFRLDAIPADTTALVASDGACSVLVNGVVVGRQGDFNPYPGFREIRVHPYDLAKFLRVGENTLRLDSEAAVTVDSPGLGLISGPGWEGATLRRNQPRDPRFLCASARPHPLPGAHWLEPAAAGGDTVLPIIPDMQPGPERIERLRFLAPLGTTALRIPTDLDVTVRIGESRYHPVDQCVQLPNPLPAGTFIELEVCAVDGRRGGALLGSAVEVEVAEVEVPLVSWEELGLRALGGQVRYRTAFPAPDGRVVLDLGEVRGTADVLVNGEFVDQLVWTPWRTEITEALRQGHNDLEVVIRGTLAGYLDDASPTTAVAAGQVRTGLFGPVTLVQHKETP
jgi:hypothetical protein